MAFPEQDCITIHDEGAEAKAATADKKGPGGSIIPGEPAQPARPAWPDGFEVLARPYATSTLIRQINQLTRRAIKALGAEDETDQQLISGCASCAVLVEHVKGNPFPGFEATPYPDDPMARVVYWSDMPTTIAVYVAQEIVRQGGNPFGPR